MEKSSEVKIKAYTLWKAVARRISLEQVNSTSTVRFEVVATTTTAAAAAAVTVD